jgi:signal transduction histidine kinase
VNNPLGVIKNYLKILELRLPEKHPAQQDIGIISKEIDRVSHTVGRLNTFSQPWTRKSRSIDINQLISDQLNLMRKSILIPARIHDHLSLQEGLPRVTSDENSLSQVFLNLIKNAAEAMRDGGNLYVSTQHVQDTTRRFVETGKAPPGTIEITIKDDGPGIPDHIESRLFEPFVSSKSGDHRGLGLSIVHNIIKELNGSITYESDEKTGTCFRISLPLISNRRV